MNKQTHDAFATLRSLCQQPHGEQTWREILKCINTWPDPETQVDLAVSYATDHLDHWPDEYRICDKQAIEMLQNKQAPLYLSVLRRLGDINKYAGKTPGLPDCAIKNASDIEWITNSEHMANIRSLNLRNHTIGDDGLLQIAQSPHLKQLEHLDLGGVDFTSEGFIAFALMLDMPNLKHLALWRTNVDDDGIIALTQNASMEHLEFLELGDTSISEVAVFAIAGSSYFYQLNNMCLWKNELAAEVADALLHPTFSNIEELEIHDTTLDDRAFIKIVSSPIFSKLKWLTFQRNDITDDSLIALANSAHVKTLEHLNLHSTVVTSEGLQTLCDSTNARTLTHLNLNNTFLGGALEIIANSPNLLNLKTLLLHNTNQSIEGLKQLFDSDIAPNLTTLRPGLGLDFRYRDFHDLFSRDDLPPLVNLDLSHTSQMGPACLRTLAKANLPHLRELSVCNMDIGDKGAEYLFNAKHNTLVSLKELHIGYAGLTDEGLHSIADSPLIKQLTELGVWGNDFTEGSIDLLMVHPGFQHLEYLGIHRCAGILYSDYARLVDAKNLQPEVRSFYTYAL